jgi:hypothetical protein
MKTIEMRKIQMISTMEKEKMRKKMTLPVMRTVLMRKCKQGKRIKLIGLMLLIELVQQSISLLKLIECRNSI